MMRYLITKPIVGTLIAIAGCLFSAADANAQLEWEMFDQAGMGRTIADNSMFDLDPAEGIIQYTTSNWQMPDLGFSSAGIVRGLPRALSAEFNILHLGDDAGELGTLRAEWLFDDAVVGAGIGMVAIGRDLDNSGLQNVDSNSFSFSGRSIGPTAFVASVDHVYSGPAPNNFFEFDLVTGTAGGIQGLEFGGPWGLGFFDELEFPVTVRVIPEPNFLILLLGGSVVLAISRQRIV